MFENEFFGIVKFIADSLDNIQIYLHNIPEGFVRPSVFFPVPDIKRLSDTLDSYASLYTMYVSFFHNSAEEAFTLGCTVFHRLSVTKNIDSVDSSGRKTGLVHIENVQLYKADEYAYQLKINWVSRCSYSGDSGSLIKNFYLNGGKL